MIDFEPWMYPLMVLAMALLTSRILFWRLDASEKRWRREHSERQARETAAE